MGILVDSAVGLVGIMLCAGIASAQSPSRDRPTDSRRPATSPSATVRVGSDAALRAALRDAVAGVRIEVASGDYAGFSAEALRGKPGKPVVVAAADSASRPVFKGGIHLTDPSYVELQGIVVERAPANGINIDDGGTFETPAKGVVLRDVLVRDCGDRGNHDGIKLSGVEDFLLAGCTVERWGRGGSAVDMVGCRRGVIEDCRFQDREAAAAATGVQMKGGTRDVTVRRCRFEHAGDRAINLGGSTGLAYFRPKTEGFEAKDLVVEDCVIVGSTAPFAFVGVDGAILRRNTLYRPRKWFARILQETTDKAFVPCRNGVFEDNLIAYRSDEISTPFNIGPGTASATFRFARNYWFCLDEPTRRSPATPAKEDAPRGGADPQFRDPARGDFRLKPGSPAEGAGAPLR